MSVSKIDVGKLYYCIIRQWSLHGFTLCSNSIYTSAHDAAYRNENCCIIMYETIICSIMYVADGIVCMHVWVVVTSHLSMHHGDLWLHVDHLLLKLFILCFGTRQPLFVLFATNSDEAYNSGNHHNHHKYHRRCSSKYHICSTVIPQSTNVNCQCSPNVDLR